jgi:hypothetical protein
MRLGQSLYIDGPIQGRLFFFTKELNFHYLKFIIYTTLFTIILKNHLFFLLFNNKMSDRVESTAPTKKRKVNVQLVEKKAYLNRKCKISTVLTADYKPYRVSIVNSYTIQSNINYKLIPFNSNYFVN